MLNQNGSANYGPWDWLMGSVEEGWHEKKNLNLAPCIHSLRVCLFVMWKGAGGQ